MILKVLNLYAGIGGNRKLWPENIKVTAVEYKEDIASIYQSFYPQDKVVVTDAHEYLLKHYGEFDFIWSSPPCPSHSRINTDGHTRKANYPDMRLYQEIIVLGNNWFKGKWVVENVIPYYKPLIMPTIILDRHCFWSNFWIWKIPTIPEIPISNQSINDRFGFSLKDVKVDNKRQILRNLVNPEIGLHIFNSMNNQERQIKLFEEL